MYRYKCIISYDGTNFMGFQIQDNLRTVELEIKNALFKLTNEDIKIYSSGRTDRYVHALGQVIHFDLENEIPPLGLKRGINSYLPKDIYFKSIEQVDVNFHARFSAKSKEYRYYINKKEYSPLLANYQAFISYKLDYNLMGEAIKLFIGTHNFKGFSSSSIDPRKDTVKTIYEAKMNEYDNYLEFIFVGTGFLKYQIRRMMGILIDIGRGKLDINIINHILETQDTNILFKTADGCGLYLYQVNY